MVRTKYSTSPNQVFEDCQENSAWSVHSEHRYGGAHYRATIRGKFNLCHHLTKQLKKEKSKCHLFLQRGRFIASFSFHNQIIKVVFLYRAPRIDKAACQPILHVRHTLVFFSHFLILSQQTKLNLGRIAEMMENRWPNFQDGKRERLFDCTFRVVFSIAYLFPRKMNLVPRHISDSKYRRYGQCVVLVVHAINFVPIELRIGWNAEIRWALGKSQVSVFANSRVYKNHELKSKKQKKDQQHQPRNRENQNKKREKERSPCTMIYKTTV